MLYVYQQLLRIREHVDVYTNSQKTEKKYTIATGQIIDFGARYTITRESGTVLGSIHQQGMRSILQATYEVADATGTVKYKIVEANPWIKVLDSIVGMVPFLGIFTGFFLQPVYHLIPAEGESKPLAILTKQPAFFEGKFTVDHMEEMGDDEELAVLSFLMMLLLERNRG